MSPLDAIGNLLGDIKVAIRIFEDELHAEANTNSSPAYYIGTHPGCFRQNQAAEILGVRMKVTRESTPPCPCFMVMFPDGLIYYPPLSEGDYTIQQRPH